MKNKINLKKGDLLVCAVLGLLCLILLAVAPRGKAPLATVSVNGEEVYRVLLSDIKQEEDIVLENGVVITVAPNGISVKESPCSGKECVAAGKLTRVGQCAVCMPMKTVVVLTGKDKNSPDAMVY